MGSANKNHCCFPTEGIGLNPVEEGDFPVSMAGPVTWLLNALGKWASREGLRQPVLISACRSVEKQYEMQKKWDRGERGGLVVRPADPKNSRHVADLDGSCWAFDLGNDDAWLQRAGAFVQSPGVLNILPGARWGGVWLNRDPVHFEVVGMRSVGSWRLT